MCLICFICFYLYILYYIYILVGCTNITPTVNKSTENHCINETFLCKIHTEKKVVVMILH